MTGDEEQAQQIITNIVVKSGVQIRHGHLFRPKLSTQFLMFSLKSRVSAEVIHGTMLGSRHEPGARVIRDARLGPLLERGDQSILREILGQAHITHDPREAGNEPG